MANKRQLAVEDFSRKSVSRSVNRRIWTQPASSYPVAAAMGLGVSFAMFDAAWIGIAIGGLALAGGAMWAYGFAFGKDRMAVKYLRRLREQMRREREARIQAIGDELTKLGCEAGSAQLSNLRVKYETFAAIVGEKFEEHELTFGRYLGVAEQVYLAGVDNLQKVVIQLKSVSSIDRSYIEKQIKYLDENGIQNSEADYEALRSRLRLADEAKERIDALLNQNEKAMTQLLETGSRLSSVDTAPGQAKLEMDAAISELSHLSNNVEIYQTQK
ncbi:hypothetical protein VDG1235_1387 [Verrucomicrobiia bacterium DG1235]|nr:hypothetical protein VDG1235_1387 [Verrucomicrobiae bacterium DG1235]